MKEAARLAQALSNSGVRIGLELEEMGVAVRARYHTCNKLRCIDLVVMYEEISEARFNVLEHAVARTCDALTHDDEVASDWRT